MTRRETSRKEEMGGARLCRTPPLTANPRRRTDHDGDSFLPRDREGGRSGSGEARRARERESTHARSSRCGERKKATAFPLRNRSAGRGTDHEAARITGGEAGNWGRGNGARNSRERRKPRPLRRRNRKRKAPNSAGETAAGQVEMGGWNGARSIREGGGEWGRRDEGVWVWGGIGAGGGLKGRRAGAGRE